jgi:DDE superfamily endonuclease
VTVLGALGADGLAAAAAAMTPSSAPPTRRCYTAVFTAFLDRVLIPELTRTKPGAVVVVVVVVDDLSPHRAPAVRARLEAAGLDPLDLPRYAPDLSPIEPLWSKLKGVLRAAAGRTIEALETAPAEALARVTPDDARGRFQHCGCALPAD